MSYLKKNIFSLLLTLFSTIITAQNLSPEVLAEFKNLSYKGMDSLINAEYYKGNYEMAIPYAIIAKDKSKKEEGGERRYAQYCENLGYFYTDIGQYEEAEPLFLEDLKIQTEISGKEAPKYANSLNNLALLYQEMGELSKAEPLLLEVKKIDEKTVGSNHKDYSATLNNLGLLYQLMGKFEEAEPLFLEAQKIDIKTIGKDHPDYAITLNNLGLLYQDMGRFAEAEPFLLQVIEIDKNNFGKEHPSYAIGLGNLALLYKNMGDLAKAAPLQVEVVAIYAKMLGKAHPKYGSSINNLAFLYNEMDLKSKAEALFLEAKDIFANALGTNHPTYARLLDNLGGLYKEQGNYSKAEALFLESKKIKVSTHGKEHFSYASTLHNLSLLYRSMGKIDSAFNYCLAGIDANSAQIGSDFKAFETLDKFDYYLNVQINESIKTLLSIIKIQHEEGGDEAKLEQYYEISKAAMRLNERIRNSFSNEGDKLKSLRTNNFFVKKGIESAFMLEKDTYQAEAFGFAEQNKSILLADAVKGNRAHSLGDLPDSLANREMFYQKKMTDLKKEQFNATTEDEKNAITETLGELNVEINEFLKSLKNKYPKYHALKYENITANTEDVQKLLDDKTLLLEYFQGERILYLFAISKNKVKLFAIPIGETVLRKRIKDIRRALSDYNFINKKSAQAYELYTKTAYWFYEEILRIALKDKGGIIENLVIIADGELGHLPFEAFLTEEIAKKGTSQKEEDLEIDYKELSYLVNDFNISYNYSATLWKENLNAAPHRNNGEMLACAASYPTADYWTNTTSAIWGENRLPYFYKVRKGLQPLPAAQKEIATLAEKFTGDFLQDDSANETFFKTNALNYGVIHLAMHGVLNHRAPMLSSLVFTEDKDSVEDNFLQAYEISHMKLNANLVVLSACETGYGEFQQGEGVISLARSFMYAGVPSLVVSLWQVNDYSTAVIMTSFYENLADGMSKDLALRQAKLSYINRAAGIAAHPAFWSPFIQLGDSSSIALATKGVKSWWMLGGGLAVLLLAGLVVMKRKKEA